MAINKTTVTIRLELSALAKNFRFRSNWRGKLILQRLHKWVEYLYEVGPQSHEQWRDAGVEDMGEFYKLQEQTA